MNIEHEFKQFIYKWVKDNFGESEADDPSWSIDELAKALRGEYYRIKDREELEFIKEDVRYVYKENYDGIEELTDEQLSAIANEYRYSEAYCDMHAEDILYFIRHELGEE